MNALTDGTVMTTISASTITSSPCPARCSKKRSPVSPAHPYALFTPSVAVRAPQATPQSETSKPAGHRRPSRRARDRRTGSAGNDLIWHLRKV